MKTSQICKLLSAAVLTAGIAGYANAATVWSGTSAPTVAFPSGSTDLATSPITDRFSGPATLSRTCFFIPITLGCTLELDGTVSESGSDVLLTITGGDSLPPTTGGGGLVTCDDVSFSGFDWTGTSAISGLPTDALDTSAVGFTVSGVTVTTPCGSCSGSIGASYSNTGRGEFAFSGSIGACSVSGTLDSVPTPSSTGGSSLYYRIWQ